ncbi:MAG TPA: hypothetical protein VIF82_05215 [Burkholderiaceae bacterium]|jgi:hypothetical protein
MSKLWPNWSAEFGRNPRLRTMLQYHPIAVGLSITAHLLFVLSVMNANSMLTFGTVPYKQKPKKDFDVYLVKQDVLTTQPHSSSSDPTKPTALAKVPQFDNTLPPSSAPIPSFPSLNILEQFRPYYYPSTELQVKPSVVLDTTLNLKLSSNREPNRSAKLRLLINEYGDVDRVIIDETSFLEHSQRLLIKALSRMKFKPGMIGNTPVKSELVIEIKEEKIETPNLPW